MPVGYCPACGGQRGAAVEPRTGVWVCTACGESVYGAPRGDERRRETLEK